MDCDTTSVGTTMVCLQVTPVHLQSYPNTFAPTPSGSCTCSSPLHTCLYKPSQRWCQATLAQSLSIVQPRLPPLQWREMHRRFHDTVGVFSHCFARQSCQSPAVVAESWLAWAVECEADAKKQGWPVVETWTCQGRSNQYAIPSFPTGWRSLAKAAAARLPREESMAPEGRLAT